VRYSVTLKKEAKKRGARRETGQETVSSYEISRKIIQKNLKLVGKSSKIAT
jgi:hypothetical protein